MSDLPPPEPTLEAPPVIAEVEQPAELPPLLDKLPIPRYVQILAVITAVVFLLGAARTPHVIEMGIKAERGKRALSTGDSEKAVAQLRAVNAAYPNATEVTLDLIDAEILNGDILDAANLTDSFNGKEVTEDQKARLDAISNKLDEILKEVEAEDAKEKKEAKDAEKAKAGKK